MTNKSLQNTDYSQVVTIRSSTSEVFMALTNHIDKWWGQHDLQADTIGKVFTVSWGEPWYQFKVLELVSNKLVHWKCIDANQIIGDMKGVQKEWVDTSLLWQIKEVDNGLVEVDFTHQGLTPQVKCYEFCSTVWNRFITEELKNYLEKRKIL